MAKSKLVDHALRYAEKGWNVFPTREIHGGTYTDERGKERELRPKIPYLRGGFNVATRNPDEIKQWWGRWPNAAIAVSCGDSNLVVVDIDVKDNRQGLNNFYKLAVSDEGALHGMTPSGGMHVVYKGLTNSSANVKKGIDLRSRGSYVLVPPSILYNPDGSKLGMYVAVDDWDREPADVPEDLVKKLKLLRQGERGRPRKDETQYEKVPHEKLLVSAKRALDRLPQEYAEDYFLWINTGLALVGLGEDGYKLWVEFSKRCPDKFDEDACQYRWDRFQPREISIGSLFFWAYDKSGVD